MIESMAQIRVNDIFDELIEENIEINKCLNVLIKFKNFVDLIFIKLKNNLESNDLQKFYDLDKEVKNVFKSQKRQLPPEDKILSERKGILFEILSSKPQNCKIIYNSETNNHSINSMNVKDIKVDPISTKNKTNTLIRRLKQNSKTNIFSKKRVEKSLKSTQNNPLIECKNRTEFKCEFEGCGKTFTTRDYLRVHNKSHSNIRYHCEWPGCNKTFKSRQSVKIHTSRDHLEVRPFVCKICSKAYGCVSDLNCHLLSHSSKSLFKCQFEGCGKAFKQKRSLKQHTILHSGIELRCDWPGCEYTTKVSARLLKHNSIHSCERPFLCDWPECGKGFKQKIYLETHQRIHSSDKRYACSWPGCQYRCTDSGNLIKHRRVHTKS